MFNLGAPELLILLIIAILIFGPDKLPEMGANLGRSIREFRKMSSDMTGGLTDEFQDLTAEMKGLQKELTSEVQGVSKDLNDSLNEIQGVVSTEAATLKGALRFDQANVALNPPPSTSIVAGAAVNPLNLPTSFEVAETGGSAPAVYDAPVAAPPLTGSAAAAAAEAAFFASLTARQPEEAQPYAPSAVADAEMPSPPGTDEMTVSETTTDGETATAEQVEAEATEPISLTPTESMPFVGGFSPAPGLDLAGAEVASDAANIPAELNAGAPVAEASTDGTPAAEAVAETTTGVTVETGTASAAAIAEPGAAVTTAPKPKRKRRSKKEATVVEPSTEPQPETTEPAPAAVVAEPVDAG